MTSRLPPGRLPPGRLPSGRIPAGRIPAGYLPAHGSTAYRALHYDLDLEYRLAANRLAGRALISAEACEPLDTVELDLGPLRVTRVTVDGRPPRRHTHAAGKLRLSLGRRLAAGTRFTVEVVYAGNPRPVRSHWGEVGWEPLTDGVLVASQPSGARSWFPCNDHPADKAGYRIAITTGSAYAVLANGTLVDGRVRGSTTRWVYEHPEPTSTYLASVQIGQYVVRESPAGSVMLRSAVPSRLLAGYAHDFGRQDRMMAVFEDLFGRYPFAGYTVVVTDDELEIPVEAQSMSIFGANHVDGRRGSERLIAHELAHQWFGNSLTPRDWRHIWLNEGPANYAEWLWSEWSGGPTAAVHAASAWQRLAADRQDLVLADPGVERMFDDRVYLRGALTMHALRRHLGDGEFFEFLREWTDTHRHGLVDTPAFTTLATARSPAAAALLTAWLLDPVLPPLPR